ncbi:hypothetical protein [Nocardia gipuzkoensis]
MVLQTGVFVIHGRARLVVPMLAAARLVDHGLLTHAMAARLAGWAQRWSPGSRIADVLALDRLPAVFALAEGRYGGRPARVGATLSAGPGVSMGSVAGAPLAVGLCLLLDGHLRTPGVHPPELVIDGHRFFAELARHCPGTGDEEDIVTLTRSWDHDATAAYQRAIDTLRRRIAQTEDLRTRLRPRPDRIP